MAKCVKCGENEAIGLMVCHNHEGPHADDQFNEVIDLCDDCVMSEYYEGLEQDALFCEFMVAVFGGTHNDWQVQLMSASMTEEQWEADTLARNR